MPPRLGATGLGDQEGVPDYTPAEQDELRVDLTELYSAGRGRLPDRAESLAEVAREMSSVISTANARSAQMGDWAVLRDSLGLAAESQAGVARAVRTLNNLASGVVAVADDFVARDQFARQVFGELSSDLTSGDVPQASVPGERDPGVVRSPGAGDDYQPNPTVALPEHELDDRDDELADDQTDVPVPVG
jgi:hypothetical protein